MLVCRTPALPVRCALIGLAAGLMGGACSSGESDRKPIATPPSLTVARPVVGGVHPTFGDPSDVKFPPADHDAAESWLEGEGSTAVAMVAATRELAEVGRSECTATKEHLNAAGTPTEMLEDAAGTPDPITAEVLVGLHQATVHVLAGCDANAYVDFAWQWQLASRRLTELGVGS